MSRGMCLQTMQLSLLQIWAIAFLGMRTKSLKMLLIFQGAIKPTKTTLLRWNWLPNTFSRWGSMTRRRTSVIKHLNYWRAIEAQTVTLLRRTLTSAEILNSSKVTFTSLLERYIMSREIFKGLNTATKILLNSMTAITQHSLILGRCFSTMTITSRLRLVSRQSLATPDIKIASRQWESLRKLRAGWARPTKASICLRKYSNLTPKTSKLTSK